MTAVRVLMSLPEEMLEEVDQVARDEFRSRSEVIRDALRDYLGMFPKNVAVKEPLAE